MKVITTNLLNRFWKNGVKPIKDSIAGKLDSSKVVNSLLTTSAGYALDARQGKALDDKITELNSNLNTIDTAILWTNTIIMRNKKHRIISFNGAETDGKITLASSDRPALSIYGSGFNLTGAATSFVIDTSGQITYSTIYGSYSGRVWGQVSYYVA